jgi:hypothetical protein
MNVPAFKKIFDRLPPEKQQEAVSQLTNEERREIVAYKEENQPENVAPNPISHLANVIEGPVNQVRGAYYGIPRGLKDLAEGLDQAARSAYETATGSPIPSIGNYGGSLQETTARAMQGREQFNAGPGQLPEAQTWRKATTIAAPFATPAGPTGLAGVLYTAGMSGLLNASEFQNPGQEQSRVQKFGIGATIGGGLRGVVETARAFPAFVQKARQTLIAKEGAALEKQTGTTMSLGQKTGNRVIASVEEGLKGTGPSAKLINKQLKEANDYMTAVAEQFSSHPAEKLTEESGRQLGVAASKAIKMYERVRTAASNLAYGNFRTEVGKRLIPVQKLKKSLEVIAKAAVPNTPEAQSGAALLSKTLKRQLKANGGKGLTANQFIDWQQSISTKLFKNLDKAGKGRVQKALIGALKDDLSAFSPDALGKFNNALGIYSRGSDIIENFKNALPTKVFGEIGAGGKMTSFDPYQASVRLENLTPYKIRAVRSAIVLHNPEAWDSVVGATIYRALDRASRSTAKLPGEPTLDTGKFLQQFVHRDKLVELIPDAGKRKSLETGLALFNRLATKFGGGGGQQMGTRQLSADFMGNMFGGNPIFIARMAGKILGPIGLSHLMMTPSGHKVLRALATESTNSVGYTNAIINLTDNYYKRYSNSQGQ